MPTYYNPTTNIVTLPYSRSNNRRDITISPGDTLATTYYLTTAEIASFGLTLLDEEPYAKLSLSFTKVEFAAAETKVVENLLDSHYLRVKTSVPVEIRINSESNPYAYPLGAYEGSLDIRNDREIFKLYLTSEDVGQAYVVELLS